jgi:hypothetical protein
MAGQRSGTGRVAGRIAAGLGILVGVVVVFVAGSILFFILGRGADVRAQARRVADLAQNGSPPGALPEDRSVSDSTAFDRLRVIATHNSYHRQADGLRMFFIGLVQPGEPAKLAYSHPALTAQLNAGVRSFELDVRLRAGHFTVAHVPLVDDRTDEPDFARALREIALWSRRNPQHVPVSILIEIKDDYMFLDPGLQKIGAAQLDALDAVIRAEIGDRLVTPDSVRGSAGTLAGALQGTGWPTVGALRGRVMVILHEDEKYRQPYVAGHPTLEGRAMFTCAPEGAPDAGVAVIDDPVKDGAWIAALVARGFLVRTRADGDGVHGATGLAAALASGAQIVSTDYPTAFQAADGYAAAFPGGRMMEVSPRFSSL